jgi:toxin ParE1/3/4
MRVELVPEAQSDIREAIAYYKTYSAGFASSFMSNVANALMQLETFPESGAVIDETVRRILIKIFPYGIFYRIHENTVFVLSVGHLRRKPRDWGK